MKRKRILSLCLGLGLIFSLSACEGVILNFGGTVGVSEDYVYDDDSDDDEEEDEDDEEEEVDVNHNYDGYYYDVVISNKDYISSMYIEEETPLLVDITRIDDFGRVHSSIAGSVWTVTLTNTNEEVISIDDDFNLKALSEGETTITVSWNEHPSLTDSVTITVSEELNVHILSITNKEELESMELVYTSEDEEEEPPAEVKTFSDVEAETEPITLEIKTELTSYYNKVVVEDYPIDGSIETVSLTSSNNEVALVSEEDLSVTIVGSGEVTITATWIGYEEEETASDSVTLLVLEPEVEPDDDDDSDGDDDDPNDEQDTTPDDEDE